MLELLCSICGKRVQGDESQAGKRFVCPDCNAKMTALKTQEKPTSLVFRMIPYVVGCFLVLGTIGLLVLAVRKTHEAAARTQSINNLKQIGLAMQSFHDGNKRMPINGCGPIANSAVTYSLNAMTSNPGSGSWLFQIIPYIDSTPVFHLSGTALSEEIPVRFTNIGCQSYTCPGRGRQSFITDAGPWSDYHINIMVNSYTTDGRGRLIAGFDAPDVKRTLLGITDGSSNTIFAGHGYIGRDAYSATTSQGNWSSVMWRGGTEGTGRALGVELPAKFTESVGPATKFMRDDWQSATGITNATSPQPWGGPFSQGALFAFCDGTVHLVAYETQNAPRFSFGTFLTPSNGDPAVTTMEFPKR